MHSLRDQREIVVIWNSSAGSTEQAEFLRQHIAALHGIALVETDSRPAAQQAVNTAVRSGARRIIAAGGDGTVSAVVEALADCEPTDTDLAVLPLGTGNDLARSLGMPLDADAAFDVCVNGHSAPMDVIRATVAAAERNIANMVTAGNSGQYSQTLTDEQKRMWGPLCYLRGVLDVLQDMQVYDIACRFDDGAPEQFRVLNVFIANGRTSGGGVPVAPEANVADGLMDVVLIRDGSPLQLASLTADFLFTSFLVNELVIWRQCRSVEIASVQPLPFSADGDVLGNAPARFVVRPDIVRVVRGPIIMTSA